MANLIEIASRASDLYFQDYPDRKAFFDEDDFKYHIAAKYSEMLNTLYQAARKDNKAETGFSSVEISAQWLIQQKVVAESPTADQSQLKYDEENLRWYAETNHNIFSFDFDAFGNGLNGIRPYGNSCNLKKISNQEIRFHDIIPTTPDIYYFLEGKNRIDFLKKPTLPLSVYYIPEVLGSDDSCIISDAMVPALITATLQLMFGAKQGNVVSQADDGNKNEVLPQQVNPALNKVQQV